MQVVFLLWPNNHQLPHVDRWVGGCGFDITSSDPPKQRLPCAPKTYMFRGFLWKINEHNLIFRGGHRSCLVKPSKSHGRRPCALGATTATLVAGWCETYGGQIGKIYRDVLENSYPDTQWDWSIHLLAFRWWFEICFIFTPYLGKWYSLTSIFFRWVETTK